MTILTHKRLDGLHQIGNKSGILDLNPELWHKIAMYTSDSVERIDWIIRELTESLDMSTMYSGSTEVEIGPMTLKNPVVLAAGFAKQSHGLKLWEACNFGGITIGGITAKAQEGNLKPRIFRFPDIQSIVNGMGLPGDGIDAEVKRLEIRQQLGLMPGVPLIANLCNSASTPELEKTYEFKLLMEKLYPYVDGFEINVSCPNQGGVCDMQQGPKLKNLLTELENHNKLLATRNSSERKALLVKIAPLSKNEHLNNGEPIKDLTLGGLELIANVCNEVGIDGVTATNTSQEHNQRLEVIEQNGESEFVGLIQKPDGTRITGGISGLGLHDQSLRTVKELRKKLDKTIPIIGVGGVGYDYEKAMLSYPPTLSIGEMMDNGASAVGILSSFVQGSIVVPSYLNYAIKRYGRDDHEYKRNFI